MTPHDFLCLLNINEFLFLCWIICSHLILFRVNKPWSEALSETGGDSPDTVFFTLDIPNSSESRKIITEITVLLDTHNVIYGPVFGNAFYFLKLVKWWRGSYGRMVSIIQHSWEVLLITDINHLHAKCLEMAFQYWSLLWSFTNNSNTCTIKGWEFSTEALFFTLNLFPLSD